MLPAVIHDTIAETTADIVERRGLGMTGVMEEGVTSEFLTHVLEVSLEFGPRRGLPVEARVRERFPSATDAEMRGAIRLAERVQRRALELTLPAWTTGGGVDDDPQFRTITGSALAALMAEFPQVAESALRSATSQAHYWHWHG